MSGTEIPRDPSGRVLRPKPSQLLADVMDALGPDHLTTRTLMAALVERDQGAGVEPRAVSPTYGWHIPVLADAPNVPFDMQELALDIEATDTGWRNVSLDLVNGWAGTMRIRRVGMMVEVLAYSVTVPANAALTIYTLPAGFRSNATRVWRGHNENTNGSVSTQLVAAGAITVIGAQTAGQKIYFNLVFMTVDPWPTTLPGTPTVLSVLGELADQSDVEATPS